MKSESGPKHCAREHEIPAPVILSLSQRDHLASHDLEYLISVAGFGIVKHSASTLVPKKSCIAASVQTNWLRECQSRLGSFLGANRLLARWSQLNFRVARESVIRE